MATTFQQHAKQFTKTLESKLEQPVRQHLKNVYTTLSLASLAAGAGATVGLYWEFSSLLAILGSLVSGIMLAVTEHTPKNENKRYNYLMAFAACSGLMLSPIIGMANYLNPHILPFSMISAFLVFGSFTLSALFSNHSKWLFMGGGLMSLLSVMLFTSIANIFIGSYFLFQTQLYLGLAVSCLFIMYDTAFIIERRRAGDTDYINHSMRLFIDLADIFRTLLVLMVEKERNNRNNRNRR